MKLTFSAFLMSTIDMSSFSSFWFWLVLASVWSILSHWVLGVPIDMVWQARRQGGQAMADLEASVRIALGRREAKVARMGPAAAALAAFLLTSLAITGFGYGVELCQAFFLLSFPMVFVVWLRHAASRRIRREALTGEALCRRLSRHRLAVQATGMAAVLVTAGWGLLHNLMAMQL